MNSFSDYLAHGNAWLFFPAALVLGALHGLEPGHSKTMMAAFIIAIRGTVSQAVLLGLSATVSHTLVIWILAPVALHFSGQLDVEGLEPWFQTATGLIIIGMATWMFRRVRREQLAAAHHDHSHPEEDQPRGAHGGPLLVTGANEQIEISVFETGVPPRFRLFFYDKDGQPIMPSAGQSINLETSRPDGQEQVFEFVAQGAYLESTSNIPEPHEFTVALKVSDGRSPITHHTRFVEDHHHHHGGDLPAAASPEYQDAHERAHAQQLRARLASQRVTTWQIVLFGLTGGLMPCSAAVAVLLVCLQIKQFLLGFALVLAFSLGLAITLVTAGAVAAVSVRQAAKRFKGFEDLARKMPYVSSAVMACIGLLIGIQGVRHLLH